MAVITHPRAGFTGTEVIRCREYDFRDGTATADLNDAERAVLSVKGYRVADDKAKGRGKRDKVKRSEPKQETPAPEIGSDVEITEEAPPEIG